MNRIDAPVQVMVAAVWCLTNKALNLEVVKTPLSGHKINDYIVLYLCHWRARKWAFYGSE